MSYIDELPKFYLITPDFEGDEIAYLKAIESSLQNGIKLVQFRSKNLSKDQYLKMANQILPLIRFYQARFLLNGEASLLSHVNADGIHLPSKECEGLSERPISHEFLLSIACHNEEQLAQAKKIEADLVVLCPVFATPSSPKGIPIGWDKFSELVAHVEIPVFALGGLEIQDYDVAIQKGAYGIAAKRALWDLKRPIP